MAACVRQVLEVLAQPAVTGRAAYVGGLPDVHRLEVRERRVGIADAFDYGEQALIHELGQLRHRGMEGHPLVDHDHVFFRDRQLRPRVAVCALRVRDDRVDAVDATSQLNHDQGPPVAGAVLRARGERSLREHAWHADPC